MKWYDVICHWRCLLNCSTCERIWMKTCEAHEAWHLSHLTCCAVLRRAALHLLYCWACWAASPQTPPRWPRNAVLECPSSESGCLRQADQADQAACSNMNIYEQKYDQKYDRMWTRWGAGTRSFQYLLSVNFVAQLIPWFLICNTWIYCHKVVPSVESVLQAKRQQTSTTTNEVSCQATNPSAWSCRSLRGVRANSSGSGSKQPGPLNSRQAKKFKWNAKFKTLTPSPFLAFCHVIICHIVLRRILLFITPSRHQRVSSQSGSPAIVVRCLWQVLCMHLP